MFFPDNTYRGAALSATHSSGAATDGVKSGVSIVVRVLLTPKEAMLILTRCLVIRNTVMHEFRNKRLFLLARSRMAQNLRR